jgi:hypothetical protein
MQTRGNAKLLFDAAETRKRWLGKWSIIMVQAVTVGLELLSIKLRHWVRSLQRWILRGNCERGKRYRQSERSGRWGGTDKVK